jgi:alanyl-tRNA synthetase
VQKVIQTEEEHFLGTVDSGIEKIEKIFAEMKKSAAVCRLPSAVSVSGADIFDMYQTFGFPPELFETMATEQGFGFDWDGFKREVEHHGEISGSAEKDLLFQDDPLAEIKKTHKTEFTGYDENGSEASVIAILADGKLVDSVPEGQTVKIILDRTPFYGEKGGQVGDKGRILGLRKTKHHLLAFEVEDTQMDGDLIVHIGHQHIPYEICDYPKTVLKVGDEVWGFLDYFGSRLPIERAHTATHLLHYVLRKTLGSHAEQQGSKIDVDMLRFDFTNHEAVDKETLLQIEQDVTGLILSSREVKSQEKNIEEARKTGAMMLFGEK